jgi:alanine dehydrogenase
MLVGVPREIKDNEYRVGFVPSTGRVAGEIVLRSSKLMVFRASARGLTSAASEALGAAPP